MSKPQMATSPSLGGKLQYQRPEAELYDLHAPLSLLSDASQSIIAIDGDVDNFEDGDEFY